MKLSTLIRRYVERCARDDHHALNQLTTLEAAEQLAAGFIAAGGALLSSHDDHYALIDDLNGAEQQGQIAKARRDLEAYDKLPAIPNTDCPTDAACNLYTPLTDAAYYLGLSVGWQLAIVATLGDTPRRRRLPTEGGNPRKRAKRTSGAPE